MMKKKASYRIMLSMFLAGTMMTPVYAQTVNTKDDSELGIPKVLVRDKTGKGDNLGDHTATGTLNMSGSDITNVITIGSDGTSAVNVDYLKKMITDPDEVVGDNLGDHTATTVLNMNGYKVTNVGNAYGGDNGDAVNIWTLNKYLDDLPGPDNLGNHIAVQDLFLNGNTIHLGALNGTDQATGLPIPGPGLTISPTMITSLALPTEPADAANKEYVDKLVDGIDLSNVVYTIGDQVIDGTKTFVKQIVANGGINTGNQKIINLADPTAPQDGVNLRTLQGVVGGLTKYSAGDGIQFLTPVGGITPIAVDSTVVRLAGEQRISGYKTFAVPINLKGTTNNSVGLDFRNRLDTLLGFMRAGGGDTKGNVTWRWGMGVSAAGDRDGNFDPTMHWTNDGMIYFGHSRGNFQFGEYLRSQNIVRTGYKIDDRALVIEPSAGYASVVLNGHGRNHIYGFQPINAQLTHFDTKLYMADSTNLYRFAALTDDNDLSKEKNLMTLRSDNNMQMYPAPDGTGGRIVNLSDPIDPQDAVNLRSLNSYLSPYIPGSGITFSAPNASGKIAINTSDDVVRTFGNQVIDGVKTFKQRININVKGTDTYGGHIENDEMRFTAASHRMMFGEPSGTINVHGDPNNTESHSFSTAIKTSSDADSGLIAFIINKNDRDGRNNGWGEILILTKDEVIVARDLRMRRAGPSGIMPGGNILMEGGMIRGLADPLDPLDAVNLKTLRAAYTGGAGISVSATGVISMDNTVVRTTGAQTIGGAKTFSDPTRINNTLLVTNSVTAASYQTSSDERLKEDIVAISAEDAEVMLDGINPVTFSYKADGREASGVIAQDVIKVMPWAVETREDGMMSVDYTQMISPLIASVKSQDDRIDSLEEMLSEEKVRNDMLEARLLALEEAVAN